MSDVAIRVENLSKMYRIGVREEQPRGLGQAVRSLAASPFGYLNRMRRPPTEEETLWALRDVSFEVKHGEVLGLIGRNGAGKSTLLKILSRITDPSGGEAQVFGRVGSLLEVGTGFHPELTGRENIYLNGAILGMHRYEIDRKFDEIVEFSGVEKFLDTPVKRYSSGMYVRLAFAVAAHLEPETLLVDEVLAVGDVAFQKKCLGKIRDIAGEGRTVVFISHNMAAVTRLCRRAILLKQGSIWAQGPVNDVTNTYLRTDWHVPTERAWSDLSQAPGDEVVRLVLVRVCAANGDTVGTIDIRQPVGIEMVYDVLEPGHVLIPNVHFVNEEGTTLFVSIDTSLEWRQNRRPAGRFTSTVWVPGNYLAEGLTLVSAALTTFDPWRIHLHENEAVAFQVIDDMSDGSARGNYHGQLPGVIRPLLNWSTRYEAIGPYPALVTANHIPQSL